MMSQFEKTHTLPFKYAVPNYSNFFLKNTSFFSRFLKFKKRELFIKFKGQQKLEIFQILPSHKKILWINISAPSLGDSLMDLASRTMLINKDLDLFTHEKNVNLYKNDLIFMKVFTHKSEVNAGLYDLVILDSYSTRSINIKTQLAPRNLFVGMYGYYNGPEVNRILFSFHRLNQLLGYIKSENEINRTSKALISFSNLDKQIIEKLRLTKDYITIAIGGEWKYRTYNKWDEVIRLLFKEDESLNIVIIGSSNALGMAKKLLINFENYNIVNCVAKYSFNQTAYIISNSKLLLCCDGGLMHAANAVKTPVVPLLSKLTSKMQLTEAIEDFSLFDKEDVNNIHVSKIIQKYIEASIFVDSHLRVE